MLSDALFDAIAEIRRYQRDYPELYSTHKDRIDQVVQSMDRLRAGCASLVPPDNREVAMPVGRAFTQVIAFMITHARTCGDELEVSEEAYEILVDVRVGCKRCQEHLSVSVDANVIDDAIVELQRRTGS